jgi:hypothetical protein
MSQPTYTNTHRPTYILSEAAGTHSKVLHKIQCQRFPHGVSLQNAWKPGRSALSHTLPLPMREFRFTGAFVCGARCFTTARLITFKPIYIHACTLTRALKTNFHAPSRNHRRANGSGEDSITQMVAYIAGGETRLAL